MLRVYRDVVNSISFFLVLLCDLMIFKDNFGICCFGFFLEMLINIISYLVIVKRSIYLGYG